MRGATPILINDRKVIAPDFESATVLRQKHLKGDTIDDEPSNSNASIDPTDKQIRDAIDCMAIKGAPNPDGRRPAHIKQMTSVRAADSKDKAFIELKRFITVCSSGQIPRAIRASIFGANLIALRKKDGGLRPSRSDSFFVGWLHERRASLLKRKPLIYYDLFN